MMGTQLETAKEKVREQLLHGKADGIVGVGIDPTGTLVAGEGSLTVFFSNCVIAKKTLKKILGSSFGVVDPHQGLRHAELLLPLAAKAISLFEHFFAFKPPILTPRTMICQQGREPGQVGCFVKVADGSVVALTARHLFDGSSGSVNLHDGEGSLGVIGDTLKLAPLACVNSSECATFSPTQGAILQGNGLISGGFALEENIKTAEGLKARSLGASGPGLGMILDTDATISYPMPGYSGDQLFVFDGQILVKTTEHTPFGIPGDSGALVLLEEKSGKLEKGDALGLYTWTDQFRYHFVTPFYSCISKFGITEIKNKF